MQQYRVPFWPDRPVSAAVMKEVPAAGINCFPWWEEYPYTPHSEARVACFREGIGVWMYSVEHPVRHQVTQQGGPVHRDSCLEFFLNPTPGESGDYLNFEMNPKGVLHLAKGPGRGSRTLIQMDDPVAFFRIQTEISPQGWWIFYVIPHAFLREHFPGYRWEEGLRARGNFYKCGDDTPHPHFGCWSPIQAPAPDFHRPECFGLIICSS